MSNQHLFEVSELVADLPGEQFAAWPACDDPEASVAERAERADQFFPVSESDTGRIAVAKSFCARCPVAEACLQYALDRGEAHGVWGGMTEGERRAELARRRAPGPEVSEGACAA